MKWKVRLSWIHISKWFEIWNLIILASCKFPLFSKCRERTLGNNLSRNVQLSLEYHSVLFLGETEAQGREGTSTVDRGLEPPCEPVFWPNAFPKFSSSLHFCAGSLFVPWMCPLSFLGLRTLFVSVGSLHLLLSVLARKSRNSKRHQLSLLGPLYRAL
jgi:hypothetical protein